MKHGIDFEQAKQLWDDHQILEVSSTFPGEERSLVVGKISEKHWTAIITMRNETIRIISVRRSRENEIQAYQRARV